MNRLIFIYMGGSCGEVNQPWDRRKKSHCEYLRENSGLGTEGYFQIIKRMKEEAIVDDVLIFAESGRNTGQTSLEGHQCYVIPHFEVLREFLKEGDIIWARGGFRSWFNLLNELKGKHWLLLYAANTGRQRWKFWDIVFDDLSGKDWYDRRNNRLFLDFRKPVNPYIFRPIKTPKIYDVCIGCSHIHDKKAQWRGVKVAIEYQKLYGEKLNCILPGRKTHGTFTNGILQDILDHDLRIRMTGMVPRNEVCEILNKSKLALFLGGHGQNDRGPLEALRCGTRVIMSFPHRHHPLISSNPDVCTVINNSDDFRQIARVIKGELGSRDFSDKTSVYMYYERSFGIEQVVLPQMKKLFTMLTASDPSQGIQSLLEEYEMING